MGYMSAGVPGLDDKDRHTGRGCEYRVGGIGSKGGKGKGHSGGNSLSTHDSSRGPPPKIDSNMSDWPCPKCGNWNWADRNECHKCLTPHPTRPRSKKTKNQAQQDRKFGLEDGSRFATGDGTREGHAGGYVEVDKERERQRKRDREDQKQEAEKRKSEKKRCSVCKR